MRSGENPAIARLRERLREARPMRLKPRGDHDLNPGMRRERPPVRAAVLIPIVAEAGAPQVLFTKRAADLQDHAGEISFPGGRIETHDPDPIAAALRETEEELGLPQGLFEILGVLDAYETRTGFLVSPVVGIIAPPFTLRPDPREVAEAFQVPLAHILDRANHRREEREAGGVARRFHVIPFGPHVIWGATAGMIMSLCELLEAPE